MRCLYMTIMSLDPTGQGQRRWSNRWKGTLNAFEATFDDACPPAASKARKIS